MYRLLPIRALLLPFLALLLVATGLAALPQAGADLRLGDEIRGGIRWLRSSQDVNAGSYGGGVAGTAWALRALAECPDHYRVVDGPFVRKALDYLIAHQDVDGTIADAAAKGDERLAQTRLAAASLALYADATTAKALSSALKRL
ncbi:MAG TPA: hypothetical protein VM509_05170, partial [Planctomycetota bacterium]|nr:hypothetical protein [Planctomycetota bacterium]